jgi:hypothetical protein
VFHYPPRGLEAVGVGAFLPEGTKGRGYSTSVGLRCPSGTGCASLRESTCPEGHQLKQLLAKQLEG